MPGESHKLCRGLSFEWQSCMRNLVRLALLLPLVSLVSVSSARADTVAVGDLVRFTDRPGSPGGEFGATIYQTSGGDAVDFFVTFCLQKTEYIDFSSTFIVGSITTHTLTDPTDKGGNASGQDFLSAQTAWLYTQFRKGNLASLGYVGNEAWANKLQNAIWYFEDELTASEKAAQAGNPFIAAANQAVAKGWSGTGKVAVLNLYRYDPSRPGGLGAEAQDQLVLVPEPSSLLLFGSGVGAMFLRRRKR